MNLVTSGRARSGLRLPMPARRLGLAAIAACAAALAGPAAWATTVSDPAHDILPSFRDDECPGCAFDDLDVISASARYNSSTLTLSATMAGAIGTTPEALYVWGVNRGSGTEFLHNLHLADPDNNPDVGAGVFFDAFVVIRPDETGTIFYLTPEATLDSLMDLAAGSVHVSGQSITVDLDRGLLPSAGFDFANFRYNLWPRYDDITMNEQVADFAPDASSFTASVPEPTAWALMITGFGLSGAAFRRRRVLAA